MIHFVKFYKLADGHSKYGKNHILLLETLFILKILG
jgi:hypothetical protein